VAAGRLEEPEPDRGDRQHLMARGVRKASGVEALKKAGSPGQVALLQRLLGMRLRLPNQGKDIDHARRRGYGTPARLETESRGCHLC
jgi:hypothetical protein